jgi:DNA polymerase-1
MKALVDGDIVAFRCVSSKDPLTEQEVEQRIEFSMNQILSQSNATQYDVYLTGNNNFRKKINPEYKANRKDKERPEHLNYARDVLTNIWGAMVCNGYEADDALGISQDKENGTTIICTIDKDLDQIPGLHFNWVRGEMYEVSELEGLQFFYKQVLIGDRADNIIGVPGIGPVKAHKLISPLTLEEDMYKTVKQLYDDPRRLCINLECLYIWR